MVALRKESVDRKILGFGFTFCQCVALRKESVDRKNDKSKKINPVALRKESVDRKTLLGTPDTWTEPVALRKESVDRKYYVRQSPRCGR